ncbi:hypothetical protein [Algicella marina]|uniref:Uncharacterized protein n=1 Tax=Algicella marina TaxID=2683284 RepID=A0A6P1T1G3_9RHOB|nr:hypothetical protein [Algicella marina]QHQ35296.1 hypothetical protein GO499_08840 [Algicella marina]
MGLDINVLARPKEGHEAEYEDLWRRYHIASGAIKPPADERGFLQKLLSPRKRENAPKLIERFQQISLPNFVTIAAPVVGQDTEADEWARQRFRDGHLKPEITSEEEALAAFEGYAAMEAMADCDGFPHYSNAGQYEGVDRTSFRGQFFDDVADIVGQDLFNQAWEPMLAPAFAAWGAALRQEADAFAAANNVEHVLGVKELDAAVEGPERQAHIIDQAARWAAFWSSRQHGSEPYF